MELTIEICKISIMAGHLIGPISRLNLKILHCIGRKVEGKMEGGVGRGQMSRSGGHGAGVYTSLRFDIRGTILRFEKNDGGRGRYFSTTRIGHVPRIWRALLKKKITYTPQGALVAMYNLGLSQS